MLTAVLGLSQDPEVDTVWSEAGGLWSLTDQLGWWVRPPGSRHFLSVQLLGDTEMNCGEQLLQ